MDAILEYEIQLGDKEKFDPSKLKLQISEDEFPQYPDWIEARTILYDGKKIDTISYLGNFDGVEPAFVVE